MSLRKLFMVLSGAVLMVPALAFAATSVTIGPSALVTSPIQLGAASAPTALFSFSINQTAAETLSSVSVTVNNNASSVVGSHLAAVSVYKDGGNGTFESGTDMLAGTQTTVAVGAPTVVATTANNSIDASGSKFFITLQTSGSWSVAPADSITVTLNTNGIATSVNSPTTAAVTTSTITATTPVVVSGPMLSSVMAKNTGGTSAKEAGDSIELMFSATTNKPVINAVNLPATLTLSNSHSFLDGSGALGGSSWSVDGKTLTLTLSAGTSLPTVALGDTVSVNGSVITSLTGAPATGNKVISGSFATQSGNDDRDGDEDEHEHHACANSLLNGKLYKVGTDATVYLAAGCKLKPFRGAAVFHARGHKFQNITTLPTLPADVTISQKPVLPAEGTLVKGSDRTVWFVDKDGHRRGFVSGEVFAALGFNFKQVQTIADTDLSLITPSTNVDNGTQHPDGAIIKCGNSGTVFEVIGSMKFPFASLDAFQSRGHSFDHILLVDCGRFQYQQGAAVSN
jgi:hypothetical protein